MNEDPIDTRSADSSKESSVFWPVKFIGRIGRIFVWFFIVFAALWSVLALYYSNLPTALRPGAAVLFVGLSVIALFFVKPRLRGRLAFFSLVTVVFVYWLLIPPSNNRQWRRDVAVLPRAEIDGDQITIHNIRNCEYRTATDFDLIHYDQTYDLSKLRSVDFFMSFWAPIPFCHTMISFGFEDGQFICVSIETRPEEHEGYSPLAGSFKQFELIYVVADERDAIRLRTNFRDEAVYLYRLNTTPEAMRRLFLRYCTRLNDLYAEPEWYLTVTRNCTTDIPRRDGGDRPRFPESWKVIINGFVDEFLYQQGSLVQDVPMKELRKLGHVNTRGQLADQDAEFSKRIREGIPGI